MRLGGQRHGAQTAPGRFGREPGDEFRGLGLFGRAAPLLVEAHDEWQTGDRRYLAEGSMAQINAPKTAATSQLVAA
ncbi:hypothetical protein [Micromonospora sp. DT47]|uniref:hypothetical protein n=1 Tax=Micromonospora sp. DT47 TaxID=3393431 RepID=UPI003CE7984F